MCVCLFVSKWLKLVGSVFIYGLYGYSLPGKKSRANDFALSFPEPGSWRFFDQIHRVYKYLIFDPKLNGTKPEIILNFIKKFNNFVHFRFSNQNFQFQFGYFLFVLNSINKGTKGRKRISYFYFISRS